MKEEAEAISCQALSREEIGGGGKSLPFPRLRPLALICVNADSREPLQPLMAFADSRPGVTLPGHFNPKSSPSHSLPEFLVGLKSYRQ